MAAGFAYIWEYRVAPGAAQEFEGMYGPGGGWAALFRRHPGYLRTELHRDVHDPRRYVTIDYWRSMADRDEFMAEFAEEFDRLDHRCAELTLRESHLGDFTPIGP